MITQWSGRAAALSLLIAAILTSPSASRAEPGVFADRIVFGQSAAFEGPTAALGLGMRQGILAAFKEANTAGGVDGRNSTSYPMTTVTTRIGRSRTPIA